MSAFYNEYDKKAAGWIRELAKQGSITDGIVDERSIAEILPADVSGYIRCHWFAGIAGWDHALKIAGWPAERHVWTASLPCQPFSAAGQQKGAADERHLWPVFFRLVRECRPECVFGEQVAQAIGFDWLDGISADLEAEGYAVGAVVLGAHSVGAPHIRQRLYWVADSTRTGRRGGRALEARRHSEFGRPSSTYGLADAGGTGLEGWGRAVSPTKRTVRQVESRGISSDWSDFTTLACADGKSRRAPVEPAFRPLANGFSGRVAVLRGFGNAIVPEVAAEFIKAFLKTT